MTIQSNLSALLKTIKAMVKKSLVFFFCFICYSSLTYTQSFSATEIECGSFWKLPVLGEDWGYNGFFFEDLNNDGSKEVLFTSHSFADNLRFWESNLINIIQLTEEEPFFKTIYQSEIIDDLYDITTVNVNDYEDDGLFEIFVGHNNGFFQVLNFDGTSLIEIFNGTVGSEISHIDFADGDNDGNKELLIGTLDSLYLLDIADYSIEVVLPIKSRNQFIVNNIDEDLNVEIITNFGVYDFSAEGLINQWEDPPFRIGELILENFNEDENQEIGNLRNGEIDIYDVENQSSIYNISASGASKFLFSDFNEDGLLDVIYDGFNAGNGLLAYNLRNDSLLFKIPTFNQKIAFLEILDTDEDGVVELISCHGYGSSGADRISAFDLDSLSMKWSTTFDQSGSVVPNAVYVTANVDEDPHDELIVLGSTSDSQEGGTGFGKNSNTLSVYDGITKELQWQFIEERGAGAFGDIWGTNVVKVANIDDDDAKEILVGSALLGNPAIIIIDSETHETEYEFSIPGASSINRMEIKDIDNDGELEIVTALQQGSSLGEVKIIVFNARTFAIEWESDDYANGSFENEFTSLYVEDIDDDGVLEIIAANYRIYIFDLVNNDFWISQETKVHNLTVANTDDDPNLEIIYYGKDQTNILRELDGKTFEKKDIWNTNNRYLDLQGLQVADLNENGLVEYYFGYENHLHFFESPDHILKSRFLGYLLNWEEGLRITNYNSNSYPKVLITSSIHAISELDMKCYSCLDFSAELTAIDPTCVGNDQDGSIISSPSGGQLPLEYLWSNGANSSSLDSLSSGYYALTLEDQYGCRSIQSVEISQPILEVEPLLISGACEVGQKGSASLKVEQGAAPFRVEWNTTATNDTIFGLESGVYYATVTDNNSCVDIITVEVPLNTVEAEGQLQSADCNGMGIGSANTNLLQGSRPFYVDWSNGEQTYQSGHIADLSAGVYTFTITDNNGCNTTDSIEIPSHVFTYNLFTEKSCKDRNTGAILVTDFDGVPPYSVNSQNVVDTGIIDRRYPRTYITRIQDQNCTLYDTTAIDTFKLHANLSPIQTSSAPLLYQITANTVGDNAPFSFQWNDSQQQTDSIATNLTPNLYSVLIQDSKGCEILVPIDLETLVSALNPTITPFNVFPNPFSNTVYIDLEENYLLEVFDTSGKLIKAMKVRGNGSNTSVELGNLSRGTYLFSITSPTVSRSVLVIKQ